MDNSEFLTCKSSGFRYSTQPWGRGFQRKMYTIRAVFWKFWSSLHFSHVSCRIDGWGDAPLRHWLRERHWNNDGERERTNANPSNRAQKLEERRKQEQEQDKSKSAGGNVEGYSTQSKRRVRRLCVGKRSTGCWSQERAKLRAFPRHLARENLALPWLQHSVHLWQY